MDYIAEIAKMELPFAPVKLPITKRVFDILVTLFLLLLFLPFIFLVVFCFLLEYIFSSASRGPLLYSEIRISKGRPFRLYKFRIFKIRSQQKYLREHGFIQTKALEQNPQNLTLLGKLLKQIYMDELPQIYNVLKGDMTLVGPRPSNEVVTWEDGRAGKFQRYLFVCGLTGPFQIVKDAKNARPQNAVDMEYIIFCKNNPGWKIILKDLYFLFQTVLIVFRAKGV